MSEATHSLPGARISPRPRTVSVNGIDIPREAIARETQNQPAKTPVDAWKKAAQALVIRELLLQEARRLTISVEPEADAEGRRETAEEAAMRGLIEAEVKTPSADEAACLRYYETHRDRFRVGDLFHVAHILLPAKPGEAAARAAAQARCEAIIKTVQQSPEAFARLAEEFSACPSREQGGSLGEVAIGDTVPEFETALRRMTSGTLHPAPVATRYGYHVIRLDRRIEGRELPFEQVRDRIAGYLDESVQRRALSQYVSVLAGRAVITGVDMPDNDSPLLQ